MVRSVRQQEEVLLHGQGASFNTAENEQVTAFLQEEYARESQEYPGSPPAYQADAALWAAKLVYISAQLILYRKENPEALRNKIHPYPAPIQAASMLSADLMLRFLPDLLIQLRAIDATDPLLPMLESILQQWPYSALVHPFEEDHLDYSLLNSHPCLAQLAVNRIVVNRKTEALKQPELQALLKANVGLYSNELLGNFTFENKEV